MLTLEEGLRRFWLPGLHELRKKPVHGIAAWLDKREFVFTTVSGRTDFSIRVLNPAHALDAYAFDAAKMASASFETFLSISECKKLPRSSAWIAIACYYGAFFSCHALLRMYGRSLIQLEASQQNSLNRVAAALGVGPTNGFEGGYYNATYDRASEEIHFRKSSASKDGSHATLWKTFNDVLRNQSSVLFADSSLFHPAANFLTDLSGLLIQDGYNGGNWLSHVRNQINYRQDFGAWHPYVKSSLASRELVKVAHRWRNNPLSFRLHYPASTIEQHVGLCSAIVAMCNAVVEDMAKSAPGERGFHHFGPIALKMVAAA